MHLRKRKIIVSVFTVTVSCSFQVALGMGGAHIHHKHACGDAGIRYTGGLPR